MAADESFQPNQPAVGLARGRRWRARHLEVALMEQLPSSWAFVTNVVAVAYCRLVWVSSRVEPSADLGGLTSAPLPDVDQIRSRPPDSGEFVFV